MKTDQFDSVHGIKVEIIICNTWRRGIPLVKTHGLGKHNSEIADRRKKLPEEPMFLSYFGTGRYFRTSTVCIFVEK